MAHRPVGEIQNTEGMLGRAEGEGEEEETSCKWNCGDQNGTLVLADTDTGQSIGSSRRGYLLQNEEIKGGGV